VSKLNKQVVSSLDIVSNGVATVLGEASCARDIVKSAFIDEGARASSAVSSIFNNYVFAKEVGQKLSPTGNVLALLVCFDCGVAREENYWCALSNLVTGALLCANTFGASFVKALSASWANTLTGVGWSVSLALAVACVLSAIQVGAHSASWTYVLTGVWLSTS
jgi:hypothetical protein